MSGNQATAVETEFVTDPAEVAVTMADLGRRFLRARQARDAAEQAVVAARAAFDATLTELRKAGQAFGEALSERAGLADMMNGKATVLIGRRVFELEKQTDSGGVKFYVGVVPAVEVPADEVAV